MTEKRFYHDSHWIMMQHKGYTENVACVFSPDDAKVIVDLLNLWDRKIRELEEMIE